MGPNDQKSMFLAVILSGLVLISWQVFFPPQKVIQENVQKIEAKESAHTKEKKEEQNAGGLRQKISQNKSVVSEIITLKNNGYEVAIENNFSVHSFFSPNQQIENFEQITGKKPFKLQVFLEDGRIVDLNLAIKKGLRGNSFDAVDDELGISLIGVLDEDGKLVFSLTSKTPYRYRLFYNSKEDSLGTRRIRQYVIHTKDTDFFDVGSTEVSEGRVRFVGISHYYHLFAIAFDEPIIAKYQSFSDGRLFVDIAVPTQSFKGDIVFTKKNYDDLIKLGNKLELSVDFGFFGILAIPILRGLQFFYKYFPNYGIAIILLTLVIRLLTFPLQFKSFKSMKKMQVVQPELQRLKKKYADDKQKMNQEMMSLFKKKGANPLGGCLPLLLQMPIFFAFYQVLYNAVELVGSPFYFWIHDLSEKDPFYVLPILMGGSMFWQSKLNPSPTAEPMQKKIMVFMPLIFTFIMKDFPAGLNLYIFVSTLFGVGQQLLVYRVTE